MLLGNNRWPTAAPALRPHAHSLPTPWSSQLHRCTSNSLGPSSIRAVASVRSCALVHSSSPPARARSSRSLALRRANPSMHADAADGDSLTEWRGVEAPFSRRLCERVPKVRWPRSSAACALVQRFTCYPCLDGLMAARVPPASTRSAVAAGRRSSCSGLHSAKRCVRSKIWWSFRSSLIENAMLCPIVSRRDASCFPGLAPSRLSSLRCPA